MQLDTEREIIDNLKKGDSNALKILFGEYYAAMCSYAFRFFNDVDQAEEVVQDIFVKLWENRRSINIGSSVKNYLFTWVRNQSLNVLKHEKVKQEYAQTIRDSLLEEEPAGNFYIDPWLSEKIEKAIESLPEKRREIFILSREKGLKYREIAEKLNISIKTVETQMGLALKDLREKLRP